MERSSGTHSGSRFPSPSPQERVIPIFSRIFKGVSRLKGIISGKLGAFDTEMHRIQRNAVSFFKRTAGRKLIEPFRTYGAFSLVASSALLVSMTNIAQQGADPESAIFGYLGKNAAASEMPRKKLAAQAGVTENLSLVPLSSGTTAVDLDEKISDGEIISSDDSVLLSARDQASISKDPEEEGGVSIYTVVSGDTVSGIASKYGITVNTILWANDLPDVDSIKPGDQIFILPVAGLSHKIAKGETIDAIAKKYKADRAQILSYNGLPANGEITEGEIIIIPGGSKEVPRPAQETLRREYATSSGTGSAIDISSGFKKLEGKAGTGHRFPYGYCTWYVAQKRFIPWGGNAGTWLYHARAMGYKTGKSPTPGSIVVTTDNAYYGHVALVEKVLSDAIVVSEMNYRGWGKVNTRTIAKTSRSIKGYIY